MGFLAGAGSVMGGNTNGNTSNQAFGQVSSALNPTLQQGAGASSALAGMLGTGGNPAAQNQAFQNFQNSNGFNFQLQQGSNAITGNAAARGLLNSGSTGKALESYGTNLADNSYNTYMQQLMGLGTLANQAGSSIGSTGQVSDNHSKSGLGI